MGEFYEPSLLLRQNAIRRSPNGSMESLVPSVKSRISWDSKSQDCQVLNKSCSMNRLNIKSNYWKIPDTDMNLTAMSIVGGVEDETTIAISSGNKSANLFIYSLDIDDKYLSHQSTISLANIHGLQWIPNNSGYLVTGNNKGYAHLISIPKPGELNEDNQQTSAEICKRFNHRKHLKNESTTTLRNTYISKLKFIHDDPNTLLSIYNDNLFDWNINNFQSQLKPSPNSITKIQGLINFDPLKGSMIGLCGKFGVSLFDLRNPKFKIPKLNDHHNKTKQCSYLMKWNPNNENVFASCHRDGVVRLWDIRKQQSYGNLYGHEDHIVSLEWNNGDLFTGASDGNIIHWDLTNDVSDLTTCTLKEGLNSINFDGKSNSLKPIMSQRQCGTVLPASNTNIIAMSSINDGQDTKVLSIDGSSYFGVHNRIYDAISIDIEDKMYYSESDLQMLAGPSSKDTLIEMQEITEPLAIQRKPVTLPYHGLAKFSYSNDTLNEKEDGDEEVEELKENQDNSELSECQITKQQEEQLEVTKQLELPKPRLIPQLPPRPSTPINFDIKFPEYEQILHQIEEVSETSSIYLDLSDNKIETCEFDEFDEFEFNKSSESQISINSILDSPNSNKTSNIFNQSQESLSTNPTIEEEFNLNKTDIIDINIIDDNYLQTTKSIYNEITIRNVLNNQYV